MTEPINSPLLVELYRAMLTSRKMDELEATLAHQGEAPFHIPCSGHEASAALAPHVRPDDWLFSHYRDKALLLARGVPAEAFFHTLLARAESCSRGRQMPGFVSWRPLNIVSAPTVVGNAALHAVGVAAAIKDRATRPFVLCAIGEGGSQEGEFFEAVAEAVRATLPVLFLIEDNRYALSTPTRGRTFFSRPDGEAEEFYGLPIRRVDGADVPAVHRVLGEAVARLRAQRRPEIVVMQCERLTSHTNADDQTVYRSAEELRRACERSDPVHRLAETLRRAGVPEAELAQAEVEAEQGVRAALEIARRGSEPVAEHGAKRPLPPELTAADREYRGVPEGRTVTMIEAMRGVLKARLAADPRVWMFGEDIEDPKGDVFGLTRGLSRAFPGRVQNAPLSEATILGTAIGRAMAGMRPVACMQFADFLPVAYNQFFSELGFSYWRSAGEWETPVVVMAVSGAYRPGLGPYHAQSPTALAAHVPGVDVYAPATAADAAGLLNAAFETGRPCLFLYPKNLLNDRAVGTSPDVDRQFVPVGRARVVRAGKDLTLVSWSSTLPFCEQAAAALARAGIEVELLDLRTISPWDRDAVLASARRTGRLLVVHEDNLTCGVGGEILATVAEALGKPCRMARVAQDDTYVPYHFGNQLEVMPSFKSILAKAAELLDMKLSWKQAPREEPGCVTVRAIGSSPSDENITITRLCVKVGDVVAEGAPIAAAEADKAALEIAAPMGGTVDAVYAHEGETLLVGAPLLRLRTDQVKTARHAAVEAEIPVLERAAAPAVQVAVSAEKAAGGPVYLASIAATVGSRLVENKDLLRGFPHWDSSYIVQRTGVERRYWVGEGENVLTLAVKACRALLEQEKMDVTELDGIVCSTGTPLAATPSLACRILKELSAGREGVLLQAHDVNAACTGYLYALQTAHDMIRSGVHRNVLVVTAETLSRVLNHQDLNTLFLFGDAATASLVTSAPRPGGNVRARLHRPVLSALGADEKILFVPFMNSPDKIIMDGQPVFKLAVRRMQEMMDAACASVGIKIEDLALIVPHQANERIIEAIRRSINRNIPFPNEKMFSHIREYGNTSSNSIPLALSRILPGSAAATAGAGAHVGLCAFGGGFTFGAAVLDIL